MKSIYSEIIEIVQLCIILFSISIFVSFSLSNIFSYADIEINKIDRTEYKDLSVILITLLQLIITTICYFYIEKLLHHLHAWKSLNKDMKKQMSITDLQVFKYASHIVLIIVLIEMNYSLKNNLHYIGNMLNLTNESSINIH